MILRFIRESIQRAPRRKALIVAAMAMGSAVATAMLGVMLDIGDKINRELRSEGANIVVTAKAASLTGGVGAVTAGLSGAATFIPESQVPNVKKIFWGLNITGVSPSLSARDGSLDVQGVLWAGLGAVNPAWRISDPGPDGALVGAGVARRNRWKQGDTINILGSAFRIAGILSTGDAVDDRVLLPLARLQELTHRPALVDRIDVSALTKPEDDFARKDPKTMTSAEYELWSCTSYVTSIAHDIEQALPGTQARPVRRVADSEGKVLDRVGGLMALITLAALLSAGLTVWSLTATTMIERRGEIAIMQAIGGGRWIVATLFELEIALIGLAGGVIGSLGGVWLARFVGQSVFHQAVEVSWILPFVIVLAAMLIAVVGAAGPLRRALQLEPAQILREGI